MARVDRSMLCAGAAGLAILAAACSTSSSIDAVAIAQPTPATAVATEPTLLPTPTATPISTATAAPAPTATPTPPPQPTPTPPPPPTPTPEPTWSLAIAEIDDETRARIEPTSWRPSCPVALDELRLLTFPYVDFDGRVAVGELIVAAVWAEQIGSVFQALFEVRYPIQRIELVDAYGGNDLASMQANNTSGFNCREVAGRPGVWSNHAFGTAIDLNPLMNPYVQGTFVDPPEGAGYVDRTVAQLGMILPGDPAVVAFGSIGWVWGGTWSGLKDYQHFSANGR